MRSLVALALMLGIAVARAQGAPAPEPAPVAPAQTPAGPAAAAPADSAPHWTCVNGSGRTVATDQTCPEGSSIVPTGGKIKPTLANLRPKADWRSNGIPVWVWCIAGVLGIVWVKFVLPEDLFKRKEAPRLEPVVFTPPPPKTPPVASRPAMVTAPTATAPPAVVAPPTPASPAQQAAPTGPIPAWTPELIGNLSLNKLETLVQRFWQARGCEVARDRAADGAIEFLVSRPGTGKLFAVVQCAPTRGDKIGLAMVKALAEHGAQKAAGIAVLYSLPGFTDEALAFAKDKPVKLIGPAALIAEIGLLPQVQQQRLLEQVLITSGPTLARG